MLIDVKELAEKVEKLLQMANTPADLAANLEKIAATVTILQQEHSSAALAAQVGKMEAKVEELEEKLEDLRAQNRQPRASQASNAADGEECVMNHNVCGTKHNTRKKDSVHYDLYYAARARCLRCCEACVQKIKSSREDINKVSETQGYTALDYARHTILQDILASQEVQESSWEIVTLLMNNGATASSK